MQSIDTLMETSEAELCRRKLGLICCFHDNLGKHRIDYISMSEGESAWKPANEHTHQVRISALSKGCIYGTMGRGFTREYYIM